MSSLSRELVFLILQFLDEEKFKETVHKPMDRYGTHWLMYYNVFRLEQESAFYFNMKYFEEQVQAGEWDEVERYLCGFTKVEDNRYSMKIFFELRKQKYLEALDKNDRPKAVEILVKDLKIFSTFNEELFKEITQLLTLDNFRQNEQLSKYGDTKSARSIMLVELKKLIEANPLFREKLTLPVFKASRLRTLINQSLNWQHQLCKNPRPNPDIKTLFIDHTCASTNGGRAPPPNHNSLAGPIPKAGVFPPIGAHGPFQPVVSPSPGAIAGWMATNNPSMPHGAIATGPPGIVQPPVAAAFLKHPRTPPGGPGFEYQMADSEHSMKRARVGPSDEVSFSGSTHPSNMYSPDDLPKTVVRNLNQGSNVMCMDFHPQQQTMLLVGTNVGDISIWEVGSREKVVHKPFKVWDISVLSMPFQTTLVKDAAISVTRCIWGPDGSILGVAFSKHIIQIYTYNPSGELRQHLEIDAHVGAVNDIAFAHPNKQLCIVTCGDDKTIKVWDAVAGRKQYTFEGHEAPVYSVCPHYKEQIQFIFSTAIDGKIKAWLYDCLGSRVDYDAPGRSCTTMAYSADGIRLFSCGTSKEGEAHLVEWNESEGAIKREYSGFRKRSMGVVQFDTTRNRFLAAGDEFQIKFWDMDSTNLLTVTDADDGLPARPKLRFNKEGSLLAVTTSDNGFKILANGDGQRMLRMLESRAYEGSRAFSDTVKPSIAGQLGPIPNASSSMASAMERERMQTPLSIGNLANAESSKVVDIKPRIVDNADKTKSWKLHEIVDCSHLKALKLPDPVASSKVMRLIYTNSGLALLALASSAVHKLWKWQKNDRNPSGKSTASVVPQLWQPANGALMSNDVNESKPAEESAACIALSKNDSYVMSASGGKVMTTFMPPPPAATYLAFHPQDNNIVAIGMEDSTIHIYNVRIDEVKMKLKGHQKQITGLAFSQTLNSLVSAGADAQASGG
ncbi:LIS1 homology motif protein [Artemisia annua]|uniref:LIS1 homology motif protein n=1 Tax=Artemisia annua TaxID=35608 RepID=A0A2U1KH67_ARTAN|nr:LIS1 homology motif protein [Artemisia annua]